MTRVALASPDWMSCVSCRFQGAPPEPVRQALIAAARALFSVDARQRQLGWVQRRLGAGTRQWSRNLWLLYFGLGAPYAAIGGLFFLLLRQGNLEDVGVALFFLSPAAFFLVGGALIVRSTSATIRRAESAAAAEPAVSPGAPLGCHVCGGDLPTADRAAGIARCRYCSADNVVRDDVLAVRKITSAASIIDEVRQHAVGLARHQRGANLRLAGIALLAPFSGAFGLALTMTITPEVPPKDQLVLVQTEFGVCVASRRPSGKYTFGEGSPAGKIPDFALDPGENGWFLATALEGRRVRNVEATGIAREISRRELMGQEHMRIGDQRAYPSEVCVDEPLPGVKVHTLAGAAAPPTASADPSPGASAQPNTSGEPADSAAPNSSASVQGE